MGIWNKWSGCNCRRARTLGQSNRRRKGDDGTASFGFSRIHNELEQTILPVRSASGPSRQTFHHSRPCYRRWFRVLPNINSGEIIRKAGAFILSMTGPTLPLYFFCHAILFFMNYDIKRSLTVTERNQFGGISDLMAHLLFHRGIVDSISAEKFLKPDYERDIHK